MTDEEEATGRRVREYLLHGACRCERDPRQPPHACAFFTNPCTCCTQCQKECHAHPAHAEAERLKTAVDSHTQRALARELGPGPATGREPPGDGGNALSQVLRRDLKAHLAGEHDTTPLPPFLDPLRETKRVLRLAQKASERAKVSTTPVQLPLLPSHPPAINGRLLTPEEQTALSDGVSPDVIDAAHRVHVCLLREPCDGDGSGNFCGRLGDLMHPCPYKLAVFTAASDELCNCCEECTRACNDEVAGV